MLIRYPNTPRAHDIVVERTRANLPVWTPWNDRGDRPLLAFWPEYIGEKLDTVPHWNCPVLFPNHIYRESLETRQLNMAPGKPMGLSRMEPFVVETRMLLRMDNGGVHCVWELLAEFFVDEHYC